MNAYISYKKKHGYDWNKIQIQFICRAENKSNIELTTTINELNLVLLHRNPFQMEGLQLFMQLFDFINVPASGPPFGVIVFPGMDNNCKRGTVIDYMEASNFVTFHDQGLLIDRYDVLEQWRALNNAIESLNEFYQFYSPDFNFMVIHVLVHTLQIVRRTNVYNILEQVVYQTNVGADLIQIFSSVLTSLEGACIRGIQQRDIDHYQEYIMIQLLIKLIQHYMNFNNTAQVGANDVYEMLEKIIAEFLLILPNAQQANNVLTVPEKPTAAQFKQLFDEDMKNSTLIDPLNKSRQSVIYNYIDEDEISFIFDDSDEDDGEGEDEDDTDSEQDFIQELADDNAQVPINFTDHGVMHFADLAQITRLAPFWIQGERLHLGHNVYVEVTGFINMEHLRQNNADYQRRERAYDVITDTYNFGNESDTDETNDELSISQFYSLGSIHSDCSYYLDESYSELEYD